MIQEDNNSKQPEIKQRHGCLTAWLIFIIVVTTAAVIFNMIADSDLIGEEYVRVVLIIMGTINVVSGVLLLMWKKLGFWGYAFSSVITILFNIAIGVPVTQSLLGLVGLIILVALLQIKTNGVSAWDNLE